MIKEYSEFIDLAPMIIRRRLVIECIYNGDIDNTKINDYMIELSDIMNMTIVTNPTSNYDEEYGYSAYMCWKESGMHVYTWKKTDSRPNFMSIDIYTCKNFEIKDIIDYTKDKFKNEITEITWKE
mgnify:CR=1 FL=1